VNPIVVDATQPAPSLARHLEWVQPRWSHPTWELHEGGQKLLTLERTHWYGDELVARLENETAVSSGVAAAWRCARRGWREVQMSRVDSDQPELSFRSFSWSADEETQTLKLSRLRGDGPIERANGTRWFWRQHGFWREIWWEIVDAKGRAIVTLHRRSKPFKIEGTALVDGTTDPTEALMAAVFGWYLLMRETRRRHAHAAH
jgi:hypothetical protein